MLVAERHHCHLSVHCDSLWSARSIRSCTEQRNTWSICDGEDKSIVQGEKSCQPCKPLLDPTTCFIDSRKPCKMWCQQHVQYNPLPTDDCKIYYFPQSKCLNCLSVRADCEFLLRAIHEKCFLTWNNVSNMGDTHTCSLVSFIGQTQTPPLW